MLAIVSGSILSFMLSQPTAPSSSYILLIDKLSVANKLAGIYFCKIYTKEPIEKKVNILYFITH